MESKYAAQTDPDAAWRPQLQPGLSGELLLQPGGAVQCAFHDPNVPYNQVIQTNLHHALSATTKIIWQPRFGFAWTPTKKNDMVIRGGFGIFGDVFPLQVAGAMASNTPQTEQLYRPQRADHPRRPRQPFPAAAAANQRLLTGFNGGGTVGSISATNPSSYLPTSLL